MTERTPEEKEYFNTMVGTGLVDLGFEKDGNW